MLKVKLGNFIIILIVLFFLGLNSACGLDDGFGQARKITAKYFVIYYAPQLDVTTLSRQLNVGVADKILSGGSASREMTDLADMVDTLFLRACDILDIHLYSFQGNIKICRNYNHLNQVYKNIFNRDLGGMCSFYVYELNTIYTSLENFQRGILGHEIAHTIISHYFVVQPPVKVAEILAGYVEYQLRKTGK
jgi:hypothetical protein